MTIFSNNSIFQPTNKLIKFNNSKFVVNSGASTISFLPLCDLKIEYSQYQRLSVTIPKGQTDYVLSFPGTGIKPTFLAINVLYKTNNPQRNYLKWKFQSSIEPKWSMTKFMTLTGTTTNPIPPLLIDNPNTECDVQLEILVASNTNDYLDDFSALVYLNGLNAINIESANEIIEFFNSNNELMYSMSTSDIVNYYRFNGQNRIVIIDTNDNAIVLDFVSLSETLQALSAINWLMQDPANKTLPKAPDLDGPIITFMPIINNNEFTIDITQYAGTFTKQNFIDDFIDTIIDMVDGNIIPTLDMINFKINGQNVVTFDNAGIYTIEVKATDIAGNTSTEILTITIQETPVIDIIPPVIEFTNNVDLNTLTIQDLELVNYNSIITSNDLRVETLLQLSDNIDGIYPLSACTINIYDNVMALIPEITSIGTYSIEYILEDSSNNVTTYQLVLQVI